VKISQKVSGGYFFDSHYSLFILIRLVNMHSYIGLHAYRQTDYFFNIGSTISSTI